MNIKITGKDIKATEAIKDYLEKKLDRIGKYFDDDIEAQMTMPLTIFNREGLNSDNVPIGSKLIENLLPHD